jgi:acyl-CoA thioesterase-1
LLTRHHPDIVIIELGANDGLRGLPVAAAHANLRAMIDASRGAGAQVLLVGMRMPPNYGRDYADRFFAMFGSLSKEAELPLAPFMLDGVADKLYQADRLHPLATAHPIILGNIWPHLQPLLKAK